MIPRSGPWFDSIQPQLYNSATKFYGRPVIHTRLESGDVLYVPSENAISSYAIQDSLTVSRMFLSNTSVDSFFFLNQQVTGDGDDENIEIISTDADDEFDEFFTKMGKNEQMVIQEAIRLKQLWKEEDAARTETNIAYQFM